MGPTQNAPKKNRKKGVHLRKVWNVFHVFVVPNVPVPIRFFCCRHGAHWNCGEKKTFLSSDPGVIISRKGDNKQNPKNQLGPCCAGFWLYMAGFPMIRREGAFYREFKSWQWPIGRWKSLCRSGESHYSKFSFELKVNDPHIRLKINENYYPGVLDMEQNSSKFTLRLGSEVIINTI